MTHRYDPVMKPGSANRFRWLVAAGLLAACSKHDEAPASGSGAPKRAMPAGIDVGPVKHLDIQVLHDLSATAAQPEHRIVSVHFFSNVPVDTRLVCRAGSYNVHVMRIAPNPASTERNESYVDGSEDVLDGPAGPTACEATPFRREDKTGFPVCWRADKVTPGACPAGTFPPPTLPAGAALDFHARRVAYAGGGLQLDGEYTVAAPLADPNATYTLTCDGVAGKSQAFEPELQRLGSGETASVHAQAFAMASEGTGTPKQCELAITTTAVKTSLGTFCIANGTATTPGPCAK